MNFPKWGAIFAALARAAADLKANAPRPAPPAMTGAALSADLDELAAAIPVMQRWLDANPGALTAADDLLAALEAEGFAWAAPARAGVDSAPSALAEAAAWLPRIVGLLTMFAPAPRGGPPITEGDWQGPQAVDNPSGAIGGGKLPL